MRGSRLFAFAFAFVLCACGLEPAAREAYAGEPVRAAVRSDCGPELIDEAEQPCVQVDVYGEGEGPAVARGDWVRVHYIVDVDGEQLDSSHGSKPLNFQVGESSNLIEGMHIGVDGMRVGERRRFTVPPELGYRGRKLAGVPATANLVFLVELIERRPAG